LALTKRTDPVSIIFGLVEVQVEEVFEAETAVDFIAADWQFFFVESSPLFIFYNFL